MRTTNISITLCWISVAFNWPADVYYVTVFCSIEPQIFGVYHEKSWKQKSHSFDIKSLLKTIYQPMNYFKTIAHNNCHKIAWHTCRERWSQCVVTEPLRNTQSWYSLCRLETDNCVHFLLRRELILSCWPMMIVKRYLFVNEVASSRAKTVSVTTATTWCSTLNESKSAWSLW